ncbi:unnamed protein product [Alopecurus aequalis]
MSDIENPPPSSAAGDTSDGVDAATPAEPSRHGFWAWKERLAIACYTGNNPQLDDDQVATVDADQCSRYIFVFLWFGVSLVLTAGFLVLMVLNPFHGAGFVATRVIAIIGFLLAFFSVGFFIELADKMAEGTTNVHWIVDCMM